MQKEVADVDMRPDMNERVAESKNLPPADVIEAAMWSDRSGSEALAHILSRRAFTQDRRVLGERCGWRRY